MLFNLCFLHGFSTRIACENYHVGEWSGASSSHKCTTLGIQEEDYLNLHLEKSTWRAEAKHTRAPTDGQGEQPGAQRARAPST